jgi:sigma-E factor negative regulatory protein RseC
MIETRGVVATVEGKYALVETERAVGCGHCQGKGCGTTALSRLACSGKREVRALNKPQARAGDRVLVGIADGAVLKGAGVVYALSLVLLTLGALAGNAYGGDLGAGLGALAGLAAGLLFARAYNHRQRDNAQFQPVVLQRL